MSNEATFLWYDLETFGRDPSFDRIAQFAARRTDMDLNPIGDPVELYCRLSADYLPDPGACLVNGITPQDVKKKGLPESDFIEKINALMSRENTCTCGFNSINFDDEFIRNALYRNLMDPYEREYKNKCSRWDILDLVRAAHDLRPQGINWPNPKENGNPVFKLTELTAANNIDQTGAHDACVDVDATIAIARLIKQKQPRLFDYYFSLRFKKEVKNLLNLQGVPQPLIHTSRIFTNPHGCSSLVVPITASFLQDNVVFFFDISKDPSLLLSATEENIFSSPGLFRVGINKSPFLTKMNTIDAEAYRRLGIDKNLCLAHYKTIIENRSSLIVKLRQAEKPFTAPEDPDYRIYSGFFSDHDKNLFSIIRNTPPEQKLSLNLAFIDKRCPEMLWRHVCRNWPEALTPEQMAKWKEFSIQRLLCPNGNPINDIFFTRRKAEEKLRDPSITERDRRILESIIDYDRSLKKFLGLSPEPSEPSPSATE